jgi:hypothetical protein
MTAADAQLQVALRCRDSGQFDATDVVGGGGMTLGRPTAGAGHGNDESGRDDRSNDEAP